MMRSAPKFLLLSFAVLALATQLLMPAAMNYGLDGSVACGTGSSANALQARMMRVAPTELLQALGYTPQIERQCEQCCSAFEGVPGSAFDQALNILPGRILVWLPKASRANTLPQFYDATGPPILRV